MASKYFIGSGATWDDDTNWSTTSGGSNDTTKPTAADDIFLDANSGNCTLDANSPCRSLDCDGYTGTLTHNASVKLSIGDATAGSGNRALRLVAGMTYTLGNNTSSEIEFVSTSATQQTIDNADKLVGRITFSGIGGSWLLNDRMRETAFNSSCVVNVTGGTVDFGSVLTHEFGGFQSTGTNTRGVTLNDNTVKINSGSGGAQVDFSQTTGLTFDAGTSTIHINSGQGGTNDNYGGLTWYNVYFESDGNGAINGDNTFNKITVGAKKRVVISGSNTIGEIDNDTPTDATQEIEFGSGETQTITTWSVSGNSSFLTLIRSTTDTAIHTLSKSSGTVTADYLDIQDSTATGGATWNAGDNSVNSGNNTGWVLPGSISRGGLTLLGVS